MKNESGFFPRLLRAMGIMVENVDDGAAESGAYADEDAGYGAPAQMAYDDPYAGADYDQSQAYGWDAQGEPESAPQYPYEEQRRARRADAQKKKARDQRAASQESGMRDERTEKGGNVINMPNQTGGYQQSARGPQPAMSVLVYRPSAFEETQKIIDNVRLMRPVIVNLEGLDTEEAQRSLDFISGASYALRGTVFKVATGIFVIAPENVDISGNFQNEMYPSEEAYYDDDLPR